jgi:flagellar motor switch protein FliN
MTSPSRTDTFPSFSDALWGAFATAITGACENPWGIAGRTDAEAPFEESAPVRFVLSFAGSLEGVCILEFSRPEALHLASKCQGDTATEFGSEHSATLLKLLEEASVHFCSAMANQLGEFSVHPAESFERIADAIGIAETTFGDDHGNRVPIRMLLNQRLQDALAAHATPIAQEEPETSSAEAALAAADAKNLDLVMDVELNVTLRFGQRQLALREVLELTSGSVIELDRQVEEPVELLLEGKVIAKGEAVVIDGNYGLRVTEVPQSAPSFLRH